MADSMNESELDKLQAQGYRELLSYVRGSRKRRPAIFRSGEYQGSTAILAKSLPRIELRSEGTTQGGPLSGLDVDNLRFFEGSWEDLKQLADHGFPVLWTVPTAILDELYSTSEEDIALRDDQISSIIKLTRTVWDETRRDYRIDSELEVLISMVLGSNESTNPEIGISLALNVLERLVSDYCNYFDFRQTRRSSTQIWDRSQSLMGLPQGVNDESANTHSCAALIGATISGIYSKSVPAGEVGFFVWPTVRGLRRNPVSHQIRLAYLTPSNMAIAAATLVGVARQLCVQQRALLS